VRHVLKTLILTGDDFGRSHAVNEAIARYHAAGALTQASLMVAEPHAGEALEIARRFPDLRVGLHLTLCDGRATERSALTNSAGSFVRSPAIAGLRYACDPRLREPLRAEIRRQFERFHGAGLPPTYWDGHTHLHLHPVVLRLTLPIAREFGFRFVRLVREPGPPALTPWIFQLLSAAAIPALHRERIDYAARVFGLRRTGRMTSATIRTALDAHTDRTTEIYFHPGAESGLPEPAELAALVRNERQT
jgi:hopanoid biosynthesis associated protein HpnK